MSEHEGRAFAYYGMCERPVADRWVINHRESVEKGGGGVSPGDGFRGISPLLQVPESTSDGPGGAGCLGNALDSAALAGPQGPAAAVQSRPLTAEHVLGM